MKKLLRSLGILLVSCGLVGCGTEKPSDNSVPPTTENFTTEKYDLKIRSKYRSVDGKLDISGEKENQHIKAGKKLQTNRFSAEAGGNGMILTVDNEGLTSLMELDPDLNVNSSGQGGRILTAPEKSTLVEVAGVEKGTNSANADGGESETDSSVAAPSRFQMVEYDSNGTYGVDIGSKVYQTLVLTERANGKIQPRSIKTKDFTFADNSLNFTTARSDVFFIKEGSYAGESEENPKSLTLTYFDAWNDNGLVKSIESIITDVLFYIDGEDSNAVSKFSLSFDDAQLNAVVDSGVYGFDTTAESVDGKFSYKTKVWLNINLIGRDFAMLIPHADSEKAITVRNPAFSEDKNSIIFAIGTAISGLTNELTNDEIASMIKENFDAYMYTDFERKTNVIDQLKVMLYHDLPKDEQRASEGDSNFIMLALPGVYYITDYGR